MNRTLLRDVPTVVSLSSEKLQTADSPLVVQSQFLVGTGIDLVDISEFTAQLHADGTTFLQVFTDMERRYARFSGHEDQSLAARWAIKEAAVKAWSTMYFGQAPDISQDHLVWSELEVINDKWGRPRLRLTGEIEAHIVQAIASRFPGYSYDWQISLSHEKDCAIGIAQLLAVRLEDVRKA